MKKLKNKIRVRRLYNRRVYSVLLEEVSIIIGILFLMGAFLVRTIWENKDFEKLFLALSFSLWYLLIFVIPFNLMEGYFLEEDCICYRYRFIPQKLLYKDIKCIIITHISSGLRTRPTPCVIMVGGEQEKVLQYCMEEKSGVLISRAVERILGADIGCYSVDNFWEMFKRGSSVVRDYSFVWNKREMHKVLEGFQGDYYVSASVIDYYDEEYGEILEKYDIDKKRIHIIDDSVDGKFRW